MNEFVHQNYVPVHIYWKYISDCVKKSTLGLLEKISKQHLLFWL